MSRTKKTIHPSCRWAEDDDGVWQTDCGNAFVFTDSGPKENGMFFCCYCGRRLQSKVSSDMREAVGASQEEG